MPRTLIALMLLLVSLMNVSANGVGVNPAKLEFEVHAGESISKTLYVINTGERKAGYNVYADNPLPCLIIDPEKFQMDPGESRAVNITVTPSEIVEYETKISVVTANPSTQLNIATGIKVPVSIAVRGAKVVVGEEKKISPSLIGNVVAFAGSSNFLVTLIAILSIVLFALVPRVRSTGKRKKLKSSREKRKGLKDV